MIDEQYGEFLLICDICEVPLDEVFDGFLEAVEARKDNHWRTIKRDGEFIDICPECQRMGAI